MRRYRRCLAAVSDGHSSEAVDGTREANTTVPLVTSAVPPALSMARGANGWTAVVASAPIWEQFLTMCADSSRAGRQSGPHSAADAAPTLRPRG
jgi:hypothetical protein